MIAAGVAIVAALWFFAEFAVLMNRFGHGFDISQTFNTETQYARRLERYASIQAALVEFETSGDWCLPLYVRIEKFLSPFYKISVVLG